MSLRVTWRDGKYWYEDITELQQTGPGAEREIRERLGSGKWLGTVDRGLAMHLVGYSPHPEYDLSGRFGYAGEKCWRVMFKYNLSDYHRYGGWRNTKGGWDNLLDCVSWVLQRKKDQGNRSYIEVPQYRVYYGKEQRLSSDAKQ